MEGVLSDTKNQLTSEILRRVEMENQVQTLREQLELQRNISEQVLHARQRCPWGQTRSPSLNNGLRFFVCVAFRRSWRSEAATRAAWWRWTLGASESLRANSPRWCSSSARTTSVSCRSTKRRCTGPSAHGCATPPRPSSAPCKTELSRQIWLPKYKQIQLLIQIFFPCFYLGHKDPLSKYQIFLFFFFFFCCCVWVAFKWPAIALRCSCRRLNKPRWRRRAACRPPERSWRPWSCGWRPSALSCSSTRTTWAHSAKCCRDPFQKASRSFDQPTRLRRQKMVLEARCQDLQRTVDRERDVWQQKLHQKDEELLTMRSQMLSQLEDYESLLDVKVALDMEINAYRKMLEVEEQRWEPDLPSSLLSVSARCQFVSPPPPQIAFVAEPISADRRRSDSRPRRLQDPGEEKEARGRLGEHPSLQTGQPLLTERPCERSRSRHEWKIRPT